jgi:ArsR family transcriptional regulator
LKTKTRRKPDNTYGLKAGSSLRLSDRTIKNLSDLFRLLADESRLKILFALSQDGELHVTALCELLNQSQPAVSHHLTLLRMANLVNFRRAGQHNVYSIETSRVQQVLDAIYSDMGNGYKQLSFGDIVLTCKTR